MGDLGEGLSHYHKQGFCSFHTPGHKGRQEFFNGLDFPGFDLTELPGLDVLHAPSGIIARALRKAAEVFGAEETFFLVNGGTAGNQAMFLALENDADKRVLLERSSHRSVMSGLVLSGLKPDYVMPVVHPDFNLSLGINLEEQTISWQEISACHFTYPGYYGSAFDLKGLLAQRTNLGFEVPILIDQAHGSHYLSDLFPPSALMLGADLVLNSCHKTLSALTQSAMLHVQGSRINRTRLRQSLEFLQSSSPSYLLLSSLERAGEYAQDVWRWQLLKEAVDELHQRVGPSFRILCAKDVGTFGIQAVDWSKILINTSPLGISAPKCVEYLREGFGIEPELWDKENILCLLGIGNTPEDVRRLTKGLESLRDFATAQGLTKSINGLGCQKGFIPPLPRAVLSPREAFFASKRKIPLKESLGHIVGETISIYPPGIPAVVMGEVMTEEVLSALLASKGEHYQGWEGFKNQTIWIIEGD
ncbi:arginine/lysine/ornithine decarboxylase [Desulfosporosinus orientis DSM 765]|uniref:Arginine/lysine/ornithine decarboxylase n=1 Tax=Desulfosporosinus orientis (strain ATCC 19365 / DSM 765 / NCIMB 8382 / VKM B-1628 / Singapore I) TaxID=768706 RepID=G7W7C0_DESOD|nr:arginine/lysine/ornithine decarboxylase [Desulfosporosinus orientis]AET65791.1 arginine/lysine/ornithine decarboxylase [Desulfosporosinus orientis DSM 765]